VPDRGRRRTVGRPRAHIGTINPEVYDPLNRKKRWEINLAWMEAISGDLNEFRREDLFF